MRCPFWSPSCYFKAGKRVPHFQRGTWLSYFRCIPSSRGNLLHLLYLLGALHDAGVLVWDILWSLHYGKQVKDLRWFELRVHVFCWSQFLKLKAEGQLLMDIVMQHACIDIDINDHDIDITYMHRYRYRNTNIHSQILKDIPAVYHTARMYGISAVKEQQKVHVLESPRTVAAMWGSPGWWS